MVIIIIIIIILVSQKAIFQSSEPFNITMSKTYQAHYKHLTSKYSKTRKYNKVIATGTHKSKNT